MQRCGVRGKERAKEREGGKKEEGLGVGMQGEGRGRDELEGKDEQGGGEGGKGEKKKN